MLRKEDAHTEFKRELTDALKKEVLAFANTSGGSIYIGIEDDGTVTGVDDQDQIMLRVASMLRDAIHPDIMMFVDIQAKQIEQRTVIHIIVSEGTNKPYYLIKNGLKPSGVYVRQGSATVPASAEQIRKMIKASDGDVYEDNISLNQELTFQKTTSLFLSHNLRFGIQQQKTLGIIRSDGLYTNVGLLLSDQCPFTIKAAVFNGDDQSEFQDRRIFTGPLFTQLEECYTYLQLKNTLSATFDGLYRKDTKAYPDTALREALLNCIIHRDYSFSASSFISVYRSRIEITSIGGLLPGIHQDDILMGISACRNKKLAEIFYRLELIEAYGTGITKIRTAYKHNLSQPEIHVSTNAFKICLPQMQSQVTPPPSALTPEATDLINYLHHNDSITRKDAETLLGLSPSTVTRILNQLIADNRLHRTGRGKNTQYHIR
ncbi:ATP-dependent DNA helicase RecG [Selenomonas sp. GACV-9]|uniref:RNA-binding domain-containing protein n=1 Tax=Selenomonas sp. GACV-9 TaxID=3158782 RepID=UPI0008F13B4F|nr:ATP-dependent DNA helicase RecG [Selenomonas ruminantium]